MLENKNPFKSASCVSLDTLERESAKKAFRAKARKALQKAQDSQKSRFDTHSSRINRTLLSILDSKIALENPKTLSTKKCAVSARNAVKRSQAKFTSAQVIHRWNSILDSQKSRNFKGHSKARKFFLKDKKLQNVSKCKNILFYAPFGFEVDTFKLIFALRAKKKKIFLPHIQGISFKMLPFRLPLQKNQYGIYESTKSQFNLTKIHIAVVPVLGIDRSFGRVGFGKGMYDRAFATKKYTRKKQIPIVFVSRIPCISTQILSQSYDLRGDYFVSAVMWCKRAQYGNNIRSDRVYNLWDSR